MVKDKASINFRLLASFKKGMKDLVSQARKSGKQHSRYDSIGGSVSSFGRQFGSLPILKRMGRKRPKLTRNRLFFG